jgi:hypothetical protein
MHNCGLLFHQSHYSWKHGLEVNLWIGNQTLVHLNARKNQRICAQLHEHVKSFSLQNVFNRTSILPYNSRTHTCETTFGTSRTNRSLYQISLLTSSPPWIIKKETALVNVYLGYGMAKPNTNHS